eukprot:8240724-Alexandrium_andersonii.AAC.1
MCIRDSRRERAHDIALHRSVATPAELAGVKIGARSEGGRQLQQGRHVRARTRARTRAKACRRAGTWARRRTGAQAHRLSLIHI